MTKAKNIKPENSKILYALEKFTAAVHSLAVGAGDIRSRLLSAYMSFHTVKQEDLPEALRMDFDIIMKELTKKEPIGSEGNVDATLSSMNDETGVEIAERIIKIEEKLSELFKD